MAVVGQRDLQTPYLRRIASTATATSSSSNAVRFVSNFKFKCCYSQIHGNVTGVQKAAIGFVPEVSDQLRVDDGADFGGFARGISNRPLPEKVTVAVDVDEVLGNFVSALNEFIADRHGSYHSISEYHVYEFFRIWKCSRDEGLTSDRTKKEESKDNNFLDKLSFLMTANNRVHEFFKTPYFEKGICPIPGAQKTLKRLADHCNLSIVTSRQNVIKNHTIEWIEKHYPGLFQEIHFGNHFALDGQSRQKSEICKALGAKVLIDDNPRYAIECAEAGIKVLLFDYENSYPWCKIDYVCEHPLVTKVHDWAEVEQELAASVLS